MNGGSESLRLAWGVLVSSPSCQRPGWGFTRVLGARDRRSEAGSPEARAQTSRCRHSGARTQPKVTATPSQLGPQPRRPASARRRGAARDLARRLPGGARPRVPTRPPREPGESPLVGGGGPSRSRGAGGVASLPPGPSQDSDLL